MRWSWCVFLFLDYVAAARSTARKGSRLISLMFKTKYQNQNQKKQIDAYLKPLAPPAKKDGAKGKPGSKEGDDGAGKNKKGRKRRKKRTNWAMIKKRAVPAECQ